MTKNEYNKWNLILGWSVFTIALFIFGMTVEPTASFWDAGEYIATSAKLQVGHPPGAPFFQMMGAFFSMFALNSEKVALMINYMSVFSSAFTILFLFWTLTILLKKLPIFTELNTLKSKVTFFGSALIGALIFCVSDSFWFNAVEAEVYAMATLVLSLLFWLGLRWEQEMNTPKGDRWLLLISFVIGLSFGVHFMGLLTIPAIGMIYYFKNTKKVTVKSFIIANIVSVSVLLFIFKLLLPLTLGFFGNSEVFFVNTFGLPFHSGTVIATLIIILFFVFALQFTRKKNWVNLNTGILCILFIFIGFSSWVMIPIRSNANTVINENAPSDARLLLAYYNLEQYPETHLFYGPMFSDMYAGQDEDNPYIDDKPKYEKDLEKGKYVIVNEWKNSRINANSKHSGFLPRLWSSEHAVNYMQFTKPLSFKIAKEYKNNQYIKQAVLRFKQEISQGDVTAEDYHQFFKEMSYYIEIEKPSLWSNIQYLFSYQMGYMYWRYFMWNFTGRQNDIQGKYTLLDGNWISGIPFIDSMRLGNQEYLPSDFKENKARNTYYFLPFILGIIGLYFLYSSDKKYFWILTLFFLFTGLALKIYLNERPFEPRERDYALVGSFYVFAIFIGIGAFNLLRKIKSIGKQKFLYPLTFIFLLAIPVLMGFQNWDDHDRSNRYTAQSMAKSYLQSIQKDADAIIFTIGDNDTFALWYAQDIEGYRTDVRTINTSLLATDWYIDQMKRKTYESNPIPSQITHDLYAFGTRDYIKYESLVDSLRWDIKDFVNWVASDHPKTKYKTLIEQAGVDPDDYPKSTQNLVYYPTNKIRIPVNKENVLKYGIVKPKDSALIVPYIDVNLPKSGITKNQMMMLDIMANNDWKRPIYFTGGSYDSSEYIWMKEYLQLEGLVYKLIPIKTPLNKDNPYLLGRIDTDLMYDVVMEWDWGNSERDDIYHDPETRKNGISYRSNMARLSEQLIKEEKYEKAEKVIDLAIEKMPVDYFQYYSLLPPFIDGYYQLEKTKKAQDLYNSVIEKYEERMNYYLSLKRGNQYVIGEEIITDIERYKTFMEVIIKHEDKKMIKENMDRFVESAKPFKYLYGEYDFYSSIIDMSIAYYMVNETKKARDIIEQNIRKYDERLNIFIDLSPDTRLAIEDRIESQLNRYQYLLDLVKENDSIKYFQQKQTAFEALKEKLESGEVE